jgi:hypothetical protein
MAVVVPVVLSAHPLTGRRYWGGDRVALLKTAIVAVSMDSQGKCEEGKH